MAKPKRTKLTDLQKKKIIADYIDNQNLSETGRMNNVEAMTVKRIVESDYDKDLLKKVKQKKEENTITTLEYMEKQHELKRRIMDKLLKGIETKADEIDMFTNVKDLATAYGIILDKEIKVKEMKQNKINYEEVNKGIMNIANLINNPVKNRTEKDIDE